MENLQGITGASTEHNRAYIVENEMVFSYLISQMEEEEVTLLCTSGQPRTAALKLISLLLAEGTELFYSGDIDPDGVRIAERLWKKFDGRFIYGGWKRQIIKRAFRKKLLDRSEIPSWMVWSIRS